ncbi:MAG: acetoin utilization protein AcuB [Planctomycetota bacterium]|jgi:acetoin utilization protein AcuB
MRLENIMKTDIVTTFANETAENAAKLMQMKRCHHLIVIGDTGVAGILSERDFGGPHGETIRANKTVADFMTPNIITANTTDTLHEAAELMRGNSIGCLPIMEDSKLRGILTVTDLLKILAGSTE